MVESEPSGKRQKLKLSLSRSRPIAATACHDGKLRDAGPQQFPAATEDNVSKTTATGGGGVDAESDSKKRPREENGSERTVVKVHNDAKKTTGGESDDEAYFSANFKAVCCSVLSEDCPESHVFTEEERSTVERFMSLSGCEQQLYVRLFLRKHQWLRVEKLRYDRISEDLGPITAGLVSKNFLLPESDLRDEGEALGLLQVSELKQLCRDMKMAGTLQRCTKTKIIRSLLSHSQQHRPLFGAPSFLSVVFKRVKALLGRCVCVGPQAVEVFSKCLLLHSLTTSLSSSSPSSSSSSSWTEESESAAFSDTVYKMLQVKIGQLVFSDYDVYVTEPLFSSPEQFSRFYAASKDLRALVAAVEAREGGDEILALVRRARDAFQQEIAGGSSAQGFMEKMTTGWVLAKTVTGGVEYLEKRGDYGGAVELLELLLGQTQFGRSLRGHWLERLSLNLDFHLGEKQKCLEVIKRALVEEADLHPARRLALTQRALKILQTNSRHKSRKVGKHGTPNLLCHFSPHDFPQPELIPAKEVVVEAQRYNIDSRPLYAIPSHENPDTFNFVSVEGLAMHHYSAAESWPCAVHAEKSTFSLMFSLLMWDTIFCPGVPNVFRTKLQAGPLDLLTGEFYTNRQELIDSRLKWIQLSKSEELSEAVEECWERNHGRLCHGADWDVLPTIQDAKSLAVCMGGKLLSKVSWQFAMFYGQSCGGLPDLTLWNPSTNTCKFVEVKGPGDRLSNKQVVWLSRLASWGCQVEVCRVKAQTR